MATTIKYRSDSGQEVTFEQTRQMESYNKIFLENNVPVSKERYELNKLVNKSYNVTSTEEIDNILLREPNSSFDFVRYQSIYKVHEIRSYKNGMLTDKSATVWNEQNNLIGYAKFDVQTNNIIPGKTEKSFYENGEERYFFEYDQYGNCLMIYDEPYGDVIYPNRIGVDPDEPFTWQGKEYYQHAEPLIPTS
ncbi:hypothetical protein [Pedobacter glucosidilyticus]|uniref:hypothetical protein n=1 Tax=Pedobacter glucosidilyticus TaxID=1122941 RepID=UPI0004073B2B|nr:hypothetical protein [Pedobacter glucosidilyticus]